MAKPASGGAGGSVGRQRAVGVSPETYREFTSEEDMEDYIQKTWDEQMEGASDLSRDAHDSYKTFSKINGMLRRDLDNEPFIWNQPLRKVRTQDPKTVGDVAAAMDATMRPSQENLTLWRGISDMPSIASGLRNGTLVGTTIDDKAFISTSTNRRIAEHFSKGESQDIVIKILAKKGTRMAAANQKYQLVDDQSEFILARNSRIRITKVVSSNSGKLELEAEVV